MTPDWMLVSIIAFFVWFLTSIFWVAYGSYKADKMRQMHAKEVEYLKYEITAAAKMVAKTEMQMRVLGATPVSKLIGGDDADQS